MTRVIGAGERRLFHKRIASADAILNEKTSSGHVKRSCSRRGAIPNSKIFG